MVLLDSILQLNREIPTFSGVMSTGEGKGLKYSNVGQVGHPDIIPSAFIQQPNLTTFSKVIHKH